MCSWYWTCRSNVYFRIESLLSVMFVSNIIMVKNGWTRHTAPLKLLPTSLVLINLLGKQLCSELLLMMKILINECRRDCAMNYTGFNALSLHVIWHCLLSYTQVIHYILFRNLIGRTFPELVEDNGDLLAMLLGQDVVE